MLEACIDKKFAGFHLNMKLKAGNETLALLGASGAGKTMTLKCLAGVEKPDTGRIVVDGQVWFDSETHVFVTPQERGVGLLFQNYALFPNMTVKQNLICGLRRQTPRGEWNMEVRRLMERFCLTGLEDRLPFQLSGGQQQRVALARCLARKPKLLLLDEPFAALDSHLRWQLEQELGATLAAYEGTALYVTHDRDEVLRLCDRVCVVRGGRSQPDTDVANWYHRPATRSAAQLAGFENVAEINDMGDGYAEIKAWGMRLACPKTAAEAVAFRARDARVTAEQEGFGIHCRILRTTEQETIVTPVDRPSCFIRADVDSRVKDGNEAWLSVPEEKIVWLTREE